MLRLNKICALFLAVGVITARGIPVLADNDLGAKASVSAEEAAENGDTTISIFQTRRNVRNVSFTVPLYVTMAVTEGESKVTMPSEYRITNDAPAVAPPNTTTYFDLAVIKMDFTKKPNSSYNTVASSSDFTPDASSEERDIVFKIGGLTMPSMDQPGTAPVDLLAEGSEFIVDPGLGGAVKLKKITADPNDASHILKLSLEGTVRDSLRLKDTLSAAQFEVKYTLALLNNDGDPLVYVGNDREKAGLPAFTPTP